LNCSFLGSKERDNETGLDYFGARYYSSTQGRFAGVDKGEPEPADPQSWNRYRYARNNPLYYVDLDGNKDEPAKSQHINQALAADPRLLEVIKASNNFSQRAFEDALLRGDLGGKLNSGSANILRGLAGEAIVADKLSSFVSGLPASYLTISQPGNLSRFGINVSLPDNIAPDIGAALTSGTVNILGIRVEASVTLKHVVADASGRTGPKGLSPDTKFGLIEVKAGFTGKNILDGAGQVARTAAFLKATGLPGVAILAVDKAAFEKLDAGTRAQIYETVNRAGGYIQLFDGLAEQAAKRSRDAIRASR